MDRWEKFCALRQRRGELLREEQERRLERAALVVREALREEKIEVRWGLPGDEAGIAELLELNGMPRWVAFEERFVVAAKPGGEALAALRYRAEPVRLLPGLLVADPWAGERRLAAALYAGAGDLAREMGVGEVLARTDRGADYPREAGYVGGAGGWRLDPARPEPRAPVGAGFAQRLPERGWRRWLALWGATSVPFFGVFRE